MELTCRDPLEIFPGIRRNLHFILMKIVGRGDRASTHREEMFASIINNYGDMISGICFSFANDRNDIADLRQDILLNIWRGLETFKASSSISTWLYRVALNTCVSTIRKRSTRIKTIAIDNIKEEEENEEIEMERIDWLNQRISRLAPLDKAILTMWLDERPYEEIAEVVGISRNNVAVRLNRIKQKLAKE